VGELDARYSSPGAAPATWRQVEEAVTAAATFWLSTARPGGRPHVTPLLAVWDGRALHFCTGPEERKARNLWADRRCVLTTGCHTLDGLDVVVEGDAVRVTDDGRLRRLAAAWEAKYGPGWRFAVRDGAFRHAEASLRGDDPGEALVYEVVPRVVFAFAKGEPYAQTRFRLGSR
jgi:nitroimidazol reductase NimA-like FMN-containing flavoprotein (pyridoxamine 5'-phosphate oxidase superfamily)